MIIKTLAVGPFASNCYIAIAETTGEAIVIDPGAEAKTIIKNINDLKAKVKLIVITHGHTDHVGALYDIKEYTGATLAIHGEDAPMLGYGSSFLGMFNHTSRKPVLAPEKSVNDGDTIKLGELDFKVLHTPGHSPGGICLAGNGVIFSGDTLFNYGIGRTDFPGCSYEALMESIVNKVLPFPDETVVYPGHGPSTTIGEERRRNPFIREYLQRRR